LDTIGRDLTADLFGDGAAGAAPSTSGWTRETIEARIRNEARRRGVDPDLAYAVAMQESGLNAQAVGDQGQGLGLFQLHAGAAQDAGINPRFRQDPGLNIVGGVTYLKQKLDQSKGDVTQALLRYNGGGDPNYVQNVMRHYPRAVQQTAAAAEPGLLTRLGRMVSPARAEAATPTAPSVGRDLTQELFGTAPAQTPTEAPGSPPPPAPESQPPPPPARPPGASQQPQRGDLLARFDALPSVQSWSPADRAARRQEFAALRPEYQEEFLRGEERPRTGQPTVPSDLVIDIEKSSTPQAPAAAPPTGVGAGSPYDYLPPSARPQVPQARQEAPVEESLTAPSTLIPLLMGGAGIKAAQPVIGEAAPYVGRLVRPVAEGLSQTLGFGTGRTIETGTPPTAGEVGENLLWSVGAGGVLEGLSATGQRLLARSQAGKAVLAAEEQTQAAKAAWQQETAAMQQAAQARRADLYAAAERRANAAQAEYQRKLAVRDEVITRERQAYDEAVRTAQEERYASAREQTLGEQQQAGARAQQYQEAVAGQQQALRQARAVPGRYAPETPSWVLYEKFGDAAKDATVDLTPAKAALAEVRASRGVLPDGSVRPFPSQVESIAATLEQATGETSLTTIREELRRLGPLTRAQDGNVRGAAKQLYGIYADVLEASPVANDLLRQANATFRKEMALQDVQEWLRPGHGIVRLDQQGRETINVGALMTRLEKQIGDDAFFARSFAPDELAALRQDMGQLAGTRAMPRGGPPAPAAPVHLPGRVADLPAGLRTPPGPPARPAVPRQELLPGGAGGGPVRPAMPEPGPVTPREALGERPRFWPSLPALGGYGALDQIATMLGVPRGVILGGRLAWGAGQQGRHLLAQALLSERLRPLVLAAQRGNGTLDPRVYGMIVAAMTPEERQAVARRQPR
jgi:transglycosylase-like protein with SLT domain